MTPVWVARYDDGSTDLDRGMVRDPAGNIIVTGQSYRAGCGMGAACYEYLTIKYDSAGNELWKSWYPDNDPPLHRTYAPYGIAVDSAGTVYVTGQHAGPGGAYDTDYGTVKYDGSDGTELWAIQYDGPANDADSGSGGVAVDASGNVYVTGSSRGVGTGGSDYATVKYSKLGGDIPTVSEWGMIMMGLLLLTTATIILRGRRAAPDAPHSLTPLR